MPVGADEVVGGYLLAAFPLHEGDLVALDVAEESGIGLPSLPGGHQEVSFGRDVSLCGSIPRKTDWKDRNLWL